MDWRCKVVRMELGKKSRRSRSAASSAIARQILETLGLTLGYTRRHRAGGRVANRHFSGMPNGATYEKGGLKSVDDVVEQCIAWIGMSCWDRSGSSALLFICVDDTGNWVLPCQTRKTSRCFESLPGHEPGLRRPQATLL